MPIKPGHVHTSIPVLISWRFFLSTFETEKKPEQLNAPDHATPHLLYFTTPSPTYTALRLLARVEGEFLISTDCFDREISFLMQMMVVTNKYEDHSWFLKVSGNMFFFSEETG